MMRDREGRKLWIQSEAGTFEPVESHAQLVARERGPGIPDWRVAAKDPDWTPAAKLGGFVFQDGAPPAASGRMKPNSSGRLQPYDTQGQYASPRGSGWTGAEGRGRATGLGRSRGTSLLAMGGAAFYEEALPEQRSPRRSQGRGTSLLSMGAELFESEQRTQRTARLESGKKAGVDSEGRAKVQGVEYDKEGNPVGEAGLEEPAALLDPVEWISGGVSLRKLWRKGNEIKIGKNWRLAPFGNRTDKKVGQLPHYHRRSPGPDGQGKPSQGMNRHRPWEKRSGDTSWKDRF